MPSSSATNEDRLQQPSSSSNSTNRSVATASFRRQLSIRSTCSTQHLPDSRFICNICYEPVDEPVVTQCGHLYCWKCLYTHLEPGMTAAERAGLTGLPMLSMNSITHNPNKRICPTCRAPCSVKSIVPIYVRATEVTRPVERIASTNNLLNEEIEVNHAAPLGNMGNGMEEGPQRHVNPEEEDDEWLALSDEDDHPPETTGLRHRSRFRSAESHVPAAGPNVVPRRPRAHSPDVANSNVDAAAAAAAPNAPPLNDGSSTPVASNIGGAGAATIHSPHSSPSRSVRVPGSPNNGAATAAGQHQVSLSNGLFPLMQVAHGAYLRHQQQPLQHQQMQQQHQQQQPYVNVPGWDRLQDMHQQNMAEDSDTDFLRLLLLLLGSFVIICLLIS